LNDDRLVEKKENVFYFRLFSITQTLQLTHSISIYATTPFTYIMAGKYFTDLLGWPSSSPPKHPIYLKNPRGYCDFRPQLFFQEIQTWHLAGSALEFKMNISTGVNQGRFANDANLEAPGSEEALASAVKNATTIVTSSVSCDNEGEVSKRLINAVTWQDFNQVGYILRSCYVTANAASPALAEACARGYTDCVRILLEAGLSPTDYISPQPCDGQQQQNNSIFQKNALHIACENGHEECAVLLILAMNDVADILIKTVPSGLTAFDILRQQDMVGIAKRLENHVDNYLARPKA
jgi:hypothetical protein